MANMKKLLHFLLALFTIAVFTACTTVDFDRSLLEPDGKEMEEKLPYLENLERGTEVRLGDIARNSYLYTIWERELRENILDCTTERKGYIGIVEIVRNSKQNFMKSKENLELEYEITIYDNDQKPVWSNSYYRRETFPLPFFPPKKDTDGKRNTENIILKSIIEEFKKDIAKERESLLEKLE